MPEKLVQLLKQVSWQALPGAEETALAQLENNLRHLPPISQMINGKDAKRILEMLFAGLPITFYDSLELTFNCPCSRERVENMLISIGADEIKEMIIEGQAEVCCHFCSEKYQFSTQELTAILQEIG